MPDTATKQRKKQISIDASPEWFEWFERLADHIGLPRTVVIDRAVRAMATQEGFKEKPPRR